MALGAQTIVVNGQRTVAPNTAAYNPTGFGPQTIGVPSTVPQMPPALGAAGGVATGSGQGATSQTSQMAQNNPHSLRWSPVWWAVIFLLGSIVLLKGVHWRDTILVGAEEHAHAGPLREGAEAEA